jgi:hypothetical protein
MTMEGEGSDKWHGTPLYTRVAWGSKQLIGRCAGAWVQVDATVGTNGVRAWQTEGIVTGWAWLEPWRKSQSGRGVNAATVANPHCDSDWSSRRSTRGVGRPGTKWCAPTASGVMGTTTSGQARRQLGDSGVGRESRRQVRAGEHGSAVKASVWSGRLVLEACALTGR